MTVASPQLRGLLEATEALRSSSDLSEILDAVAGTISRTLGFGTVVINLYRPAWHDYEVVVVHGSPQARRTLLHTTRTVEECIPLMAERFRHGNAYFIPHGSYDWDSAGVSYVPELEPRDHPRAWLPEDALFVPLYSGGGEIQGLLSVDEPTSGLRPGPEELQTLAAVAAQAALAVESAQRADEATRRRAAAEHLLRVSAYLARERDPIQMLEVVCAGIADGLDFDKVVVFLRERERGFLSPVASAGCSPEEFAALPDLELADATRLLRPELEQEGCVLIDRGTAHALTPVGLHHIYSSWANGRGPHAWCNHWLLVPLRDRDDRLLGCIWADDPRDRLRPGRDRLQLMRTFANQVTSALESARHTERLRYLSQHDPLTGLLNRLGLREGADALLASESAEPLAIVVCDIDGFKRVNDVLGYEAGDTVLRVVAEALRTNTPEDGLAVRLGGEDFALVVPDTDASSVLAVAEQLRSAVARSVTMVPWDVTVSAGVAVTGGDLRDTGALLRAATRALFAAKRLGRDRTVVYSPEALEVLLGTLEDGSGREQLSAMILLAETLDLRDPHTARHSQTVGRHAENIARELGFTADQVERIRVAGVLHDIGKLGLPDAILHKPGPLDPHEWAEIERHPEMGARILDHANLRDVAAWVLCHHERVDGKGYPRRLSGSGIPVEARILAVADAYEAMTADRPYRKALPAEIAVEELERQRGTQFDADVVDAFLRLLGPSAGSNRPR